MRFLVYHNRGDGTYILGATMTDRWISLDNLLLKGFDSIRLEKQKLAFKSKSDQKIRTIYGYIMIWKDDVVAVETD